MTHPSQHIAFIGGGNMASAIIGGLIRQGMTPQQITVVEPFAETAAKLLKDFGITALPAASAALSQADLVVWAVKPQMFSEAAMPVQQHTRAALHLSVAAGIRTDSICRWVGTERVVRCMPNTPALVGQGITGLFPCPSVTHADKALVEQVIGTTGQYVWVDQESKLDAVTALSGSGPAYVFYFLEAMTEAGVGMGLSAEQAYQKGIYGDGGRDWNYVSRMQITNGAYTATNGLPQNLVRNNVQVATATWGGLVYSGPLQGLVVTRYGHALPCERIEIVQAAHPVPDATGLAATARMLDLLRSLGEGVPFIGAELRLAVNEQLLWIRAELRPVRLDDPLNEATGCVL